MLKLFDWSQSNFTAVTSFPERKKEKKKQKTFDEVTSEHHGVGFERQHAIDDATHKVAPDQR